MSLREPKKIPYRKIDIPGVDTTRYIVPPPRHEWEFGNQFTYDKLQRSEVYNQNVGKRGFHNNLESNMADLRQQLSRQAAAKLCKSNAGVKRIAGIVYSEDEKDDKNPQFQHTGVKRRYTHGDVSPPHPDNADDNSSVSDASPRAYHEEDAEDAAIYDYYNSLAATPIRETKSTKVSMGL
jgi:hypothetical protein